MLGKNVMDLTHPLFIVANLGHVIMSWSHSSHLEVRHFVLECAIVLKFIYCP